MVQRWAEWMLCPPSGARGNAGGWPSAGGRGPAAGLSEVRDPELLVQCAGAGLPWAPPVCQ